MTNQYNRYFINLYQQDTYCTVSPKEAMGRCRIETKADKGKIYIWVQNLKKDTYDVYLINASENECKSINIGQLSSNSHGYGEINFNFTVDNILDTNIPIEKINVVAITPQNKKTIVALDGYKNSKIKWRDLFAMDDKNFAADEKENEIEEPKANESIQNENETDHEKTEIFHSQKQDCTGSENLNEALEFETADKNNFKALAAKISQEIEQLNQYKFISEEELMSLKPKKDVSINYMLENNAKMSPFEKQNRNVNWVRVSIRELINLPIDYWNLANHPFVLSAYYKNKHMIFGCDAKKDEYILGLPDKYQPEYKGILKKLGFVQFKCCQDKLPIKNDYGYWLMPIYL